MRHTTSFRNVLPLALVALMLVGSLGCVADVEEIDEDVQEGDGAVNAGQLSSKFGAANVKFAAPQGTSTSENVFNGLYDAGVRHVRQHAYLRWRDGVGQVKESIGAMYKTDPSNGALAYPGMDLFIMIHLAGCSDSTVDCYEIYGGSYKETSKFSERFKEIYDAANPCPVDASGGCDENLRTINVRTWSINEPDVDMSSVRNWPLRAAHFYKAAREVLDAHGCAGCILVAGEFGALGSEKRRRGLRRYLKELKSLKQEPAEFGFHPYRDIGEVTNIKNLTPKKVLDREPVQTKRFIRMVRRHFNGARFWLTEVGLQIHNPDFKHCEKCGWAAGYYVRNKLAEMPRVGRVYWWDMATSGSDCEKRVPGSKKRVPGSKYWDSALADHNGNLRAMYYGLLGYGWDYSRDNSPGEPGPWIDGDPNTKPCD